MKTILSLNKNNEMNYYINVSIKQNLRVRQLIEKIRDNEYGRLEYKDNIGQIKYYMNYIDTNIKKDYMNKSIVIILCKEDNNIVVKYCTDERVLFTTYKINN